MVLTTEKRDLVCLCDTKKTYNFPRLGTMYVQIISFTWHQSTAVALVHSEEIKLSAQKMLEENLEDIEWIYGFKSDGACY